VPDRGLDRHRHPHGGAYRRTPVRHLPTIMDRLDAAGLAWRLYAATKAAHSPQQWNVPYGWAICPTFADCLYTQQSRHEVPNRRVIGDAAAGRLPSFSVVLPNVRHSQHNLDSMRAGDNWIGRVVAAIENGPDWSSTAIFITYDDCGCFYDHVPPPRGLGVRVPMVIVSPYARAGFTDSRTASFSSMLAFAERTLGVAPLSERDAGAYAYADSFDFTQTPQAPVRLRSRPVGARERTWLRAHPAPPDGT
jgi:phospholipase C